MSQTLTPEEITRTRELCFRDPVKACALAQTIIDTCQIVSCSTFAKVNEASKRNVQYLAKQLTGITIEKRKFISINQ